MIGVIGGMGPLATADFFRKVIAATPVHDDAGHVPLLIQSDPRIPPRPAAILGRGPSPLPSLLAARERLLVAGAKGLVMPCNTAHHWYAELVAGCPVPFPSIVDTACDEAGRVAATGARVGLVATRATLAAGLFDAPLAARGLASMTPSDELLDSLMLPAIAQVKAGRLEPAGAMMARAVQALLDDGADAVILGCTEAPLALETAPALLRARCVDSTDALARATVALWRRLCEA